MKKIILNLLFLAILLPVTAQESGIRFFHGTWDEAIALAKKEKKKIFVDFYTEWCGPCLNMSLTVFVLPQVGDVYNKNFVCLKIDAEKGEGRELAKRYGVNSYPTYIFVNPKNQEIVHRSGSNKPVEDFLYDAQGGINPKLGSVYMDKKYAVGKYDLDFLKDYIRYKKSSGSREVQKYFDELISKGAKLTEPDVWKLYCKCIIGYQNPYVKEVSDNYSQFTELFGKKEIFVPYTFKENMTPVKLPNLDMIYKTDKLGNAEGIENFLSEATRFDAEALRKNIDVTVVPMLAFNKDKFRLGYGGGYYDRYLFCRHTVKIGLAYDEQQNDEIEFEKHDVPLDVIVTPTRVIGRI